MRHASLVLALLAAGTLTADAKPKGKAKGKGKTKVSGKVHMDKAAKAHKAGSFDVALTELQAAYDIEPQPKLLFAIAQVQAKLDNCPEAVANYEKFLASTKDKQKQAVVKQAIKACNQKIAAAPAQPKPEDSPFRDKKPEEPVAVVDKPAEPPPPAQPPPPPPPTQPPPPPSPLDTPSPAGEDNILAPNDNPLVPATTTVRVDKPWYKDVIGDALVIGGVAAGVVSFVMYTGARGDLDDAEKAPSIEAYQDLVDSAHDKRTYAVLFAGGGAVLIGAGIVRYKLRDKGEARGVAVAPARGGGLITWTGGF